MFRGKDAELSVIGRLAAGACAGMTSTFVSNSSMEMRIFIILLPIGRGYLKDNVSVLKEVHEFVS